MKKRIKAFSELGKGLSSFGTDEKSQQVISHAIHANPWFREDDVTNAIKAISDHMLQEDLLMKWVLQYPPVKKPVNILVVAAGNIPAVGFFDLLCVLISGHRCIFKPSSKDAVLMDFICSELKRSWPEVPVSLSYDSDEYADAVIATGSGNAIRQFKNKWRSIPAIYRSDRSSVAVLSGNETKEDIRKLADDIFSYNGMGCRNVSLLLLAEGTDIKNICRIISKRGCKNPKYYNNYLQKKTLLIMQGTPFIDGGHFLLIENTEFPDALSMINYQYYKDRNFVRKWVSEHENTIQCIPTSCFEHPRAVEFGKTQSPGLDDYPDGVDIMEFLSALPG